jgi:MFS superfamily sulfate permease-like transporter
LTGYICGISLTLLTAQIERLTTRTRAEQRAVSAIDRAWWPAGADSPADSRSDVGYFLLLRLLKRLAPRSPGPLVAVSIGLLLSYLFDLEAFGISLLWEIPATPPSLVLPVPRSVEVDDMVLNALGILIVSFGIVTACSFGAKNRYRVDANRELIGFGAANIASGLFGGFPFTGADSRTAVNDAVGGRTQLAGLVAAAVLIVVLVALSGVTRYMPIAILGAVIASAAVDLFDAEGLRRLWRTSHPDFTFALVALAGVVACSKACRSPLLPPVYTCWPVCRARPRRCLVVFLMVARLSISCIANRVPSRSQVWPSISSREACYFSTAIMSEIASGGS